MLVVRDPHEYNALMAEYNSCLIEELLRALRKYPGRPKYLKLDPGLYFNVDTRELCIEPKERWRIKDG
jgi:hypothetical protein